MIWVSDGSKITQGIALKKYTWFDGLPFNYRSYRVYMAQELQPDIAPFRVHPAQEHGQYRPTGNSYNISNLYLEYRVLNGRYSDVPYTECSNGYWNDFGVLNYNDTGKLAPHFSPRSTQTGEKSPYLVRYYDGSINGSFKSSRNGIWTTTFNKDTHLHFYINFLFYGTFMMLNKNTSPSTIPKSLDMIAYSSTSDTGTWISSAGTVSLDIPESAFGFPVDAGEVNIGGIDYHYKILIVKQPYQASYKADNLILNNGLSELSMPFIKFGTKSSTQSTEGDFVYFLEYGFNISYSYN